MEQEHKRRMLEKLEGKGHMYATDMDPLSRRKRKSGWRLM